MTGTGENIQAGGGPQDFRRAADRLAARHFADAWSVLGEVLAKHNLEEAAVSIDDTAEVLDDALTALTRVHDLHAEVERLESVEDDYLKVRAELEHTKSAWAAQRDRLNAAHEYSTFHAAARHRHRWRADLIGTLIVVATFFALVVAL